MASIAELIDLVPHGETRLFTREAHQDRPERFISVHQSWEYGEGRLTWNNAPSMEAAPWLGSRGTQRIPVATLIDPDIEFAGPASDLVDLYSTASHAFFVSPALFDVLERLDPGAVEGKRVVIRARDGRRDYWAVMVARQIDAIDPHYTDVLVRYRNLGGHWLRSVEFPDGLAFRSDIPADVHTFSTCDTSNWYWSRELLGAVKAAGLRGVLVRSPANVNASMIEWV